MPRITPVEAGGKNVLAFLDAIAISELGSDILADPRSDDGYRTLVGSTPTHLVTFDSYADHPRRLIEVRPGLSSTAAGRYQLLARWFDPYKKLLGLRDFSPRSQDLIALQQIRERGALPAIRKGDIEQAIRLCSATWASLPGNSYGQHTQSMDFLLSAYAQAGGLRAVA